MCTFPRPASGAAFRAPVPPGSLWGGVLVCLYCSSSLLTYRFVSSRSYTPIALQPSATCGCLIELSCCATCRWRRSCAARQSPCLHDGIRDAVGAAGGGCQVGSHIDRLGWACCVSAGCQSVCTWCMHMGWLPALGDMPGWKVVRSSRQGGLLAGSRLAQCKGCLEHQSGISAPWRLRASSAHVGVCVVANGNVDARSLDLVPPAPCRHPPPAAKRPQAPAACSTRPGATAGEEFVRSLRHHEWAQCWLLAPWRQQTAFGAVRGGGAAGGGGGGTPRGPAALCS